MNRTQTILKLAAMLAVLVLFASGCGASDRDRDALDEHETGFAQANGITIAYESFGSTDRETVLMIAGTGQQLIDWPVALIQELVRRGYRVVIYDNRDVGLSTKFTEAGLPDSAAIARAFEEGKPLPLPYTLNDMAEDAVGLLDALDIQQAHIVGASMGGAIAQLVAIDHPERTLSLTSIMADSGNPALPAIAKPEAFASLPTPPPAGDQEAFVEYQVKVFQALASPGYPTSEESIRAMIERGVERSYDPDGLTRQQAVSLMGHLDSAAYRLSNLKNIQVPTVVVQGADDPLVPVESAEDIAAEVPGADLIIVPGMGHDIPVQLAQTFADAISKAAQQAAGPEG